MLHPCWFSKESIQSLRRQESTRPALSSLLPSLTTSSFFTGERCILLIYPHIYPSYLLSYIKPSYLLSYIYSTYLSSCVCPSQLPSQMHLPCYPQKSILLYLPYLATPYIYASYLTPSLSTFTYLPSFIYIPSFLSQH